jgi:dihydrolipoamide dehydrogenase
VALVEMDALGGTCLNRGCNDSKALISAANVAYDAPTGSEMEIAAEIDVDVQRMADNGQTFGRDTPSPDAVGSNS